MKLLINGETITEVFNRKVKMKELMEIDRMIGQVRKDKKMYARLVLLVALVLICSTNPVLATGAIDEEGMMLFKEVVGILKWFFVTKGAFEIGQKVCSGCDMSDIAAILSKYGFGFGAIICLPVLMEKLIKILGGL